MGDILLASLLLILAQSLLFGAGFLLIRAALIRKQQEIEQRVSETIHSWIDAEGDGKPSKLAVTLEAMGAVVGSAAARSLMASIGADGAHMAKAANNVSDQIEAQTNPLGMLLKGGRRGKGAAIDRLSGLVMQLFQNSSGGGNGNTPTPPPQQSFSL
jgi:hypothetical protein